MPNLFNLSSLPSSSLTLCDYPGHSGRRRGFYFGLLTPVALLLGYRSHVGPSWHSPVPAEPDRSMESEKGVVSRCLPQIPSTRTFWMMPKLSSIVIMNLIANLPLLYHKPKNTRILH